jgi:hypothetical protein
LFPDVRKALIASLMIGNTVLEPPIRMMETVLPVLWARDCEWARGEQARIAANSDTTPNLANGNRD